MLNIRALTFNLLQERCYVAWSEAGRCVIADPGCDGPAELQALTALLAQDVDRELLGALSERLTAFL